jgi:ATP-dependent protease ClpP protease subunit
MTAQRWYSIRAAGAHAAAAEVFIYGDIGESWWGESVTAAQFVKDFAAIDATEITVRINSYGGSVSDGIAIYNAIQRHPATVAVAIDGVAVSIASLIAMAGNRVEMAENALLMLHAPWGAASGNSAHMRQYADLLDTWAQAMTSSYAKKSGQPREDILALLTDGKDHWYTADEAKAAGFVDDVTESIPVAASLDLSRFSPPAARAVHSPETPMPEKTQPGAAAPTAAAPDVTEIQAKALADDRQRRAAIKAAFAPFAQRDGVTALLETCSDDPNCAVADAHARLLAHLGKDVKPIAGDYVPRVEAGADEKDKRMAAFAHAVMARAGIGKLDGANEFRGQRLLDLARGSLDRAGVKHAGQDVRQIVAAAFTTSTSDFPILLENTLYKTLLAAYAIAPDTWTRFCKTGSVTDFRANNRYRAGSFGNLDALTELGEFRNKAIPDGEKASITASTKGNLISISRQAIINDDLGAFVGLANALGRAARRTIEADVYSLLASNPTLNDGVALFHATHGNLAGTGTAVTMAAMEAARQAMASQKDVGNNDYLDLRPAIWLGGMAYGGDARSVNSAEYDPDTANKLQKPNVVRGLVNQVVDTARITGNTWYLFADPADAPVLEVAFLDGVQEPYLEMENGFDVDGARYKVRLDYGVAALDYRGAYKNAGA